MAATNLRKVVFLCSGGGGNLCFIYEAIKRNWIEGLEIAAVLTDRECQANYFASSVGLPNKCIDFSCQGQQYLMDELLDIDPDLIVTTVHKILAMSVVDKYRDKLINLHYSLLPSFGGLIGAQTVKAAMDFGAKFAGVTVHLVDESVDGGKPITQGVVPIHNMDDSLSAVMNVVFRCGCLALLAAINLRLTPESTDSTRYIEVMGRPCLFNGGALSSLPMLAEEDFWRCIAGK